MAEIPDQPTDNMQLARSLASALAGGGEPSAPAALSHSTRCPEISRLTRALRGSPDNFVMDARTLANRWAEFSSHASLAVRTG